MALANATLTDTSAVIYTCANAAGAAVVTIAFTNTDSVARTITAHLCPSGEGETSENMIIKALSLGAGETYVWDYKTLMSNTDTIEAFASVTSVVTVTVSYLNF